MQTSETITKEIFDLEKKFWTAMQEHDLKSAISLTDFPCLVAGANGVLSVDKEQFEKMFNSEQESIKAFKFEEDSVEVRQVSPDTAIIGYKVHSTIFKDGQEKTIDAVDTSTWIKRNNNWVCSMHTETELSKPN